MRSLLFACLLAAGVSRAEVVVNDVALSAQTVHALQQQFGVRAQDGRWWYDARSGAFGAYGGPAIGLLPAGLALGGPLRGDASGGGDGRYGGVFVNGRELHPQDIAALRAAIGQVVPGHYWMDAAGNFGYAGGGLLGNLHALAQAAGGAGPRGSAASGCSDASCRHSRSWLGQGYFSDGKSGCIVLEGEVSC